ncbi:MAG: diguanylate cyclase [Ruminococcus sp.]|nr:diguanylate cyclase [Ruminococcus sp.]
MENDDRLKNISDISRIIPADGGVCRRLLDSMYDGIGLFELREGKVSALYLNERFFEVAGYSPEQYRPYLDNVTVTFFEEDEKRFLKNALKYAGENKEACFEVRGRRGDGSVGWFCIRSRKVDFIERDVPVYLAAVYDCTKNKETELNLKLDRARYRILEETGTAFLFEYDPFKDEMVFFPGRDEDERRFEEYSRHLRTSSSIHPEDSAYFYFIMLKASRREQKGSVCARSTDRKGGWQICRMNYTSIAGDRDDVIKVLGRINTEDGADDGGGFMRQRADEGTRLISERLNARPERALLMLADIDGMNGINERFGFGKGSELLGRFGQAAARIFKSGIVFGYAEDVFAVYMEGLTENELYCLTDRLRTAVPALDFSAGVAFVKDGSSGETPRDYLITASKALYRAKKEGINSIVTEKVPRENKQEA